MTNLIILLQTIISLLAAVNSPAIPFEIKQQAVNLSYQAVELVKENIAPQELVFGGIGTLISKEVLLEKFNQAPQIRQKYILENATFKMKAKDDPKDRIDVKVGGDTEFEPKMKIERWDNEVSLSVKLIDNEVGNPILSFDKDKIIWSKGNKEVNFYDLPISVENPEGGYEFEIILREKPNTNIVEFDISTKGLDFFYQPELTQKEKDKGASRPENVVGSYAVYTSENKTNYVGGKEYKVGKFGHIYRPKITDSAGKETWGILNIDKGILSVEIPQEFLDKAIYPVIVDPTFGYETAGASSEDYGGRIRGSQFTGAAGNGVSITTYCIVTQGNTTKYKAALYQHTDLAFVTNGNTEESVVEVPSAAWRTLNFVSAPTLTAQDYIIVFWTENTAYTNETMYYDDGVGTTQGHMQEIAYGNWPNPLNPTHEDRKYSIYATYEAAGDGAVAPEMQVIIIE